MKYVPFTAYIRLVPANDSKKVYWRDLQKQAESVYEALVDAGINIASPGGGQFGFGGFDRRTNYGCGIRPQFGSNPSLLQVTGFHTYNEAAAVGDQYANSGLIAANESVSGPQTQPQITTPASWVVSGVKDLKADLLAAIGSSYSIFRIDYAGVIYGDRGFHFPR